MAYSIRELEEEDFPRLLFEIPDPPEKLFVSGKLPGEKTKYLCVVGSRKYTEYGKEACRKLIEGLSGYDIAIVSGLALGIDAIAHKAALEAGLKTVAIPGSGLHSNVIYPRTNRLLAEEIVEKEGALLSEFEEKFRATPYSFPQRNRIMAGMSHAVLIIEAEPRSGTLITARLGMEYNRDVFVVPGSIFSRGSMGTNDLIRNGALPIISSEDLLKELGFDYDEPKALQRESNLSSEERVVIDLLKSPMSRDKLIEKLGIDVSKANVLISAMEIKGLIKESLGELRVG